MAPRKRAESYCELVAQTSAVLSRNMPLDELIKTATSLITNFFAADTAIVVLPQGDEDAEAAVANVTDLREQVFADRTIRVLRGAAALRSGRGRSLHAPVQFGTTLLGAVAVMCTCGEGYGQSDLELLQSWSTLLALYANGLQLAARNSTLEALVGTDSLTGLHNRRGLENEVDLIWRAARRTGESLAIVMIDVDFFKGYNDTFGHLAGDHALRQIANTIAAGLRPGDIAARFGGEEFVALLRTADRERAIRIAERLRENIAALHISHPGSSLEIVSASFGVATTIPRSHDDPSVIFAAADRLLYRAKEAGRNRVAAEGYMANSPGVQPQFSGGHNLPEFRSSFCGRAGDTSNVLEALDRSRLVTLVAFGGVGKTRLSVEAAGRRMRSFRNGVWFVDLAGSSDPELLPERVAAAIGLPDVPGSRTISGVAQLLAAHELLIVLDNCEHLVADCARFCAEVLAVAPAVRILATSREALGLPQEVIIALAPLEMPAAGLALSSNDVGRYPALKLFVDRAAAIAPFDLTNENVATVAAICRRLDGIALAIELAAARVRMLTLSELRARIEARLGVIDRSPGEGASRGRTLRGLIDWSYDLLDDSERKIFSRLGVFAGPFTLELANSVCSDDGQDVLDTLETLVDKSLIVVESHHTGARAFRLFDSIREYAWDRLSAAGESDELRRRLIARVCAHAAEIATARPTARWRTAMEPLEHSVEDVRACLAATILGEEDRMAGVALASDVAEYWQVRGRAHEGRTWLERALAIPGLAPGARATLLNSYLWHQPLFGDAWRCEAMATEALELATVAGDETQVTVAIAHIADAAFDLGQFERAYEFGTCALDRFVTAGDLYGEAYAANCIGVALDLTGNLNLASAEVACDYTWYNRAIDICRGIERRAFAARALGNVAESEFFLGRVVVSIAMTKSAIADLERENDRPALGWLRCNLGLFHQYCGEFDIAKSVLLDALDLLIEIHDDWLIAACCDNLAGIALHYELPDGAAQFLGCADMMFANIALARQPAFAKIADAWRTAARTALGDERFEKQTAIGATLSRAQALVKARNLGSAADCAGVEHRSHG